MLRYRYLFKRVSVAAALSVAAGSVAACAGWDNPTALSELQPTVTFDVEADALETFEEIHVTVRVMNGGAMMEMSEAHLEYGLVSGDETSTVEMEEHQDGWEAHVTFYEAGDHHLHFLGTPHRHHLAREFGEHELTIARHHQVIGPYWVELNVRPVPVFEHSTAHIELFVYDLATDGSRGPVAAPGVPIEVEVHDPSAGETAVSFVEENAGEYAAEFEFEGAGVYELHVTLGPIGAQGMGEFHVPVLDPNALNGSGDTTNTGGGHGHGN